MSGTDALYGFAAHDPRRFSPQIALAVKARALPQSMVAHAALAFVATTCLFTVYSHIGTGEMPAVSVTTNAPKPAVAVAASASTPEPANVTVIQKTSRAPVRRDFAGLLDGQHLGLASGTLSRGKTSKLADHLGPPSMPGPAGRAAMVQASPAVRDIAQSVPLPMPRPSSLLASLPQANDAAPAPAPVQAPAVAAKGVVEDKATVLALISSRKNSLFNRLFSKPKSEGPTLAYAASDPDLATHSISNTILFDGMPKYDQWTAVYDISARRVYLPDGTELEAHSGLGKRMDDPRNVHVKMHGATPPHVYNLTMRESLFHGVEAVRLTPVGGEGRIFNRTGLLAHTYMLGPRGDSNGCVSFKDYATFVQAYKSGMVKRMVVVARLG